MQSMNRVQPMAAQLIIHLKYHNVFDKLWNLQKKQFQLELFISMGMQNTIH